MITNILVLLGGAGVIQSLFLSVYVLTSKLRKRFSNILLLLLNFFVLIFLVNSLYLFLSNDHGLKTFSSISLSSLALIGPLTFFYLKSFLIKDFKFGKREMIHIIPIMLPVIFGFGFCKLHITIVGGYLFLYLISSFLWTRKIKMSPKHAFWVYSLLGGLTLLTSLITFFSLGKLCIIGISIGFTVITYFVSYLGFRLYQDLFCPVVETQNKIAKLPLEDSKTIFEMTVQQVTSQKLYKDPDLTLPTLAAKLNIHTHRLSFVINSQAGISFTEYINGLRITEAKKLLSDTQTKVAAIAFECGFNSLSSFYAIFKKETGMSPSEFRRSLKR